MPNTPVPPLEPQRSRPYMPEYGIPSEEEGMLPWSHVLERITAARNYWVSTVKPDGTPHATPVWGVFVDNMLYFGGGNQARRSRNLEGNPAVVVHLESAEDVVIVEGVTQKFTETNLDADLLKRVDDAYEAKYQMRHGTPIWAVRPLRVFAWQAYPTTVTRWIFQK